jgi:hypothetical protein
VPKKKVKPPAKKQKETKPPLPLVPDRFYRRYEVVENKYFGYSNQQLQELIERDEIEPPIALSKDGRAVGWFGRDILRMQAELEAAAKQRSRAA